MRYSTSIFIFTILLLFLYTACDKIDAQESVEKEQETRGHDIKVFNDAPITSKERVAFTFGNTANKEEVATNLQLTYQPVGVCVAAGGSTLNWSLTKRYDDGEPVETSCISNPYNIVLGENISYEFVMTATCERATSIAFDLRVEDGELVILDGIVGEIAGAERERGTGIDNASSAVQGVFLP